MATIIRKTLKVLMSCTAFCAHPAELAVIPVSRWGRCVFRSARALCDESFTLENGGGTLPSLKSARREPVGRPAGYIIPKYVNADPRFRNKDFLRGYYLAGDSLQELYGMCSGCAASVGISGARWPKRFRIISASTHRESACRSTRIS